MNNLLGIIFLNEICPGNSSTNKKKTIQLTNK